jgi:hypothetical protein
MAFTDPTIDIVTAEVLRVGTSSWSKTTFPLFVSQ